MLDVLVGFAQSNLLNYLRTGNPIIDAILTTFVIASLSYVVSSFRNILSAICTLFTGTWLTQGPSLTVYLADDAIQYGYYTKLSWFLTKYHPPKTGDVYYVRQSGTYVLMSLPGNKQSVEYQGAKITYVWGKVEVETSKNTKKTEYHLTLTTKGVDNTILIAFVKHVCEAYHNELLTITWQQRLFLFDSTISGYTAQMSDNSKTFDSIILPEGEKQRLMGDLESFIASESFYKTRGIAWTRGYLFHGLPGCGKTSLIKAISFVNKLDLYVLNLNDITDDAQLRKAFSAMPSKCVLVLEDIDCMGTIAHRRERDEGDEEGEQQKDHQGTVSGKRQRLHESASRIDDEGPPIGPSLSELLNQMDGIASFHGRITIMTTNRINVLDEALIRPGRIDYKIEFKYCKLFEVQAFWELFLPDTPFPTGLPFDLYEPFLTASMVSGMLLANRTDPIAAETALRHVLSTGPVGPV